MEKKLKKDLEKENPFVKSTGMLSTKSKIEYTKFRTYGELKHNNQKIVLNDFNVDKEMMQVSFSKKFIKLIMSTSLTEQDFKVLGYIIMKLQPNSTVIKLDPKVIAKHKGCVPEHVRASLRKLKKLDIFSEINGKGCLFMKHINPKMLFKGDRIKYLKEYYPHIISCIYVNDVPL